MRTRLDLCLVLAAALAGCGGNPEEPPSAAVSAAQVVAARQLPAAVADDAKAVAAANNQFACDVYKKLGATAGNVFFSPFSISTALAMADAGAAGDTDTELRAALHFTLPGARLHAAYGALLTSLAKGRSFGAYTLATADRLFGQQGFAFLPAFLQITRDDYGAELLPVDFAGDTEVARTTINQWVSSQTDAKIPELFAPGVLNGLTHLVLANAIVFKGTWKEQFRPELTSTRDFQLADGGSVPVPLMYRTGAIAHGAIPGGQVAVLPYKGEDLSMVLLVPDAKDGLPSVEAALTSDALAQWIAAVSASELYVGVPRFGINAGSELVSVLQAIGVKKAFDASTADFSAMDGARDLVVGAVVHKAVVTVDELGTEAAAATGVGVTTASMPPSIIADHPFIFLIYDHVTDSVLFMGRLDDPSK